MATRMTAKERRQAPRVAERVAVAISSSDGEAIQAETQNLSTTGAYCLLDRFIAPLTKLELAFELPNGARRTRIRGTGVVVRVEPRITEGSQSHYYVAIFFSEMSERHRDAISKFVRRRLPSSSPTR